MGRWLFYLLVLGNLAIFLWHITRYQPEYTNPQVAGPLLINSEQITIVKQIAVEGFEREIETDEAIPPPQVEQKEKLSHSTDSSLPPFTVEEEQSKGVEPEETPLVEHNQQSYSENEQSRLTDDRTEPVAILSTDDVCYEIYPVSEVDNEKLQPIFEVNNIPNQSVIELHSEAAGYLVLIEPMATATLANRKMRQVKQLGLDAFVMNRGKWNKGISLGVYSNQGNAQKGLIIARKTMPNERIYIAPRFREKKAYRVTLRLSQSQNLENLLGDTLKMTKNRQQSEKISKIICKEIEIFNSSH